MTDRENINFWLRPLSWMYGWGVWFRNKFFDWGILPGEEFPVPVISVGNLAVGGTGKTPHIEYLIHILSKKYKIAVLSRGYKRKTTGFILAGEKATERIIGDEPFQIHRKFPEIQVAVDEDRRRGIKNLLNLPDDIKPEVILLDDAFQHRYVKPSYSVLLTDSSRLYYQDELLPLGRLREHKDGAIRAHAVIVTKCTDDLKPIDYRIIENHLELFPYQRLYFTSYKYKSLIPVFRESTQVKRESLEHLKLEDYSFLLVAGIANPTPLIDYLNKYTKDLKTIIYDDHHSFARKDIEDICTEFRKMPEEKKLIITTEKDSARLLENPNIPEDIKPYLFYLPIEVVFNLDKEESFKHEIYNHVEEFKRNSILA